MADTATDRSKYSLGTEKAQDVYGRLSSKRQQVIDLGRLMAELTVPAIVPPEGYEPGDDIPGNNQSVGAQCLNTLASALMFMAFPPNQPIARLRALEYMVQKEVDQDPDLWARVQLALTALERAHRERLATTNIATCYVEYIKLLLVAGNALWRHIKLAEPTYHSPCDYVVKRDKAGNPLLTIMKDRVNLQGMDEDHREFILSTLPKDHFKDQPEWQREVDVYYCQKLVRKTGDPHWVYWEEWEGHLLAGTDAEADFEEPPMWPGWLIPVYGKDWGRGYCEEYRGDLFTIEAHASAVNDGASLAALSLLFAKPGTQTSIAQIRKARNLSILPGSAEDLSVFRSDKSADYNFVVSNMEAVARRLSRAFLMQSSVQRSGERVTKEEIVRLGQELDKALGGLYTQIAQGNQRVIIKRAFRLNEIEHPELPELPKGLVEIQVITGIDALGDSTEAEDLKDWGGTMKELFDVQFAQRANVGTFGKRYAAVKGIKPDGLMKDDEQVAQEQDDQQRKALSAQMLDKATGPAAKAIADGMGQGGGGIPPQIAQQLGQQAAPLH